MACDFQVTKLTGEDKILLFHTSQGGTDTGFGAAQATSTVRLTGSSVNTTLSPTYAWTPIAIIVGLPPGLADGTYTVTLTVVGATSTCTQNAQLTIAAPPADVISDLVFAAASPLVADLGATIEIVNTKPGFVWQQSIHEPVDLLNLSDVVAPPLQNIAGWQTNRLTMTLPDAGAYALQSPLEAHTIRFDSISQRIAISLKASGLDPLALTIVIPETVLAGGVIQLLNVMPGFSWDSTQHGVPQLLDDQRSQVQGLTYISGWGTQKLEFGLPPAAQYPPQNGAFPMHLKFPNSQFEPLFVISKVPLPQVLMIKRLHCDSTEDWIGGDECRLEVKLDVAPWIALPVVDMDEGDDHDYDAPFVFINSAEVRLYDEDVGGPDSDDHLGTNTLYPGSATSVSFTKDDADYTLSFTILPLG